MPRGRASGLGLVVALLLLPGPLHADGLPSATHRGSFNRLGHDYARFVSPGNLVFLGAGGLAALGVHAYDRRLTDDFHDSARLDGFFEIGDVAGGDLVQGGVALGTFVAGRLAHSPKLAQLGGDLVRAQIIGGSVTLGLKFAVGRERPDGGRLSFPSGHTSASFGMATVLEQHFGWKAGVPAYALATYIGASRLQENKHFASDVLFGAAIGIAAGRAVTFGHGRKRIALAPIVVRGGVGIACVGIGH